MIREVSRVDWSRYHPYFLAHEFVCTHCGREQMQPVFMDKLLKLRLAYRKEMPITSGYRCPDHPKEAEKAVPGAHAMGLSADVAVTGRDAFRLMQLAMALGDFTGIGVQQKGDKRFLHLDCVEDSMTLARPMVWSY